MVSHAGSPEQVPEVQFRRGLGTRIRPAMALAGRFTGSSFVRKLLQTKVHAASNPSPLEWGYRLGTVHEGMSRQSPKPRARLRTLGYYYHCDIGTKFSELRTKTDSVASGIGPSQSPSPLPEWGGSDPAPHRPNSRERQKALRSTFSRTRYWIALSSMRSTSGW